MNYLIIAVVDDIKNCPSLMEAWEEIGASGITILESTGLGRLRKKTTYRDDLPLMPSLRNLLQTREEHHRTLFTVVRDEEMIDRVFEATESVLGDLSEPNKGIIFALPITRTLGLPKQQKNSGQKDAG